MPLAVALVCSLVLSALFSGVEIAYLSANRLRIELDRKTNSLSQRVVRIYVQHPAQFIATLLVGNNVALVIYGMAMSDLLAPWLATFSANETYQLLSQTAISTVIILIVAEFLPKALFRIHPNAFLTLFALPVFLFYILLHPIASGITLLSHGLLKIFFRQRLVEHAAGSTLGPQDLNHLVDEATQVSDSQDQDAVDQEIRIFQNALEFSDVKVRECLVPRPDIEAIPITASLQDLRHLFITTNFSRIPVYQDTVDNIVGYVNAKRLFEHPASIREAMRPLTFIPETMKASDLLSQFIKNSRSMAIVVDEFGGTAGLVTIEDLVEEIFGEIDDEHDTQSIVMRQTGPHEYLLSGRAEVDVINEMFKLDIPDSDDYDTVAGFILDNQPSIPQPNDTIQIGQFRIRILQVDGSRISLLSLSVDPES